MLTHPQRADSQSKNIRSQSTFPNPLFRFVNGCMGGRTMCTFQYRGVMQSRDCVHMQREEDGAADGLYLSSVKQVISLLLLRVTDSRHASYVTHSTSTWRNSLSKLQKISRAWKPIELILVWSVHPTRNSTEDGSSCFPSFSLSIICMCVRVCGVLWYRLRSLSCLPIAMLE